MGDTPGWIMYIRKFFCVVRIFYLSYSLESSLLDDLDVWFWWLSLGEEEHVFFRLHITTFTFVPILVSNLIENFYTHNIKFRIKSNTRTNEAVCLKTRGCESFLHVTLLSFKAPQSAFNSVKPRSVNFLIPYLLFHVSLG